MISSTSVESEDRWQKFCRKATEPLKKVREGTRVRNFMSKERGVITGRIDRASPFVRVRVSGKNHESLWFAWHVRIDEDRDKKGRKKKKH